MTKRSFRYGMFHCASLTGYSPPFGLFYSVTTCCARSFFTRISYSTCYNIFSCRFVQKTADGYALSAHKSNMSKGGGDADVHNRLHCSSRFVYDIVLPWIFHRKKHQRRTKIAAPRLR